MQLPYAIGRLDRGALYLPTESKVVQFHVVLGMDQLPRFRVLSEAEKNPFRE